MGQLMGGTTSFIGGVNLTGAEDQLSPGEVRRARNMRVARAKYGAIEKRQATRRIHETALPGEVQGVYQWRPPEGVLASRSDLQTLAVANGDLYYKNPGATDFTKVTVGGDTTAKVDFEIHRELQSDGVTVSQRVYFVFGNGSGLWSWNGTSLRNDVTENAAPSTLSRIEVYNTRLFGVEHQSRRLYWSGVNDPTQWSFPDAGAADVGVYDQDDLVGIKGVRGALALVKAQSTARFTGYDYRDIRIEAETEGIAASTGCVAPSTIVQVEDIIFMLSEEGPYLVTEGAVRFVGDNLEEVWDGMDITNGDHIAVHMKKRREIVLFVDDLELGQRCWAFNYRMRTWWGPWEFPFTVTCATPFRCSSTCAYSVLIGCADGFVRNLDAEEVGKALDDVLLDGTGGTPIEGEVILQDEVFLNPLINKVCSPQQVLIGDLGAEGAVELSWSSESGEGVPLVVNTQGPGVKEYFFRTDMKGRRIIPVLKDETSEITRINAVLLRALEGKERPS